MYKVVISYLSNVRGLYINYPQALELAHSVSSPWGERSAIFWSCIHLRSNNFHSTCYQLLLDVQRECGIKACPRLLHMTGAVGIEPQTPRSWVQCFNHSATCSTLQIAQVKSMFFTRRCGIERNG